MDMLIRFIRGALFQCPILPLLGVVFRSSAVYHLFGRESEGGSFSEAFPVLLKVAKVPSAAPSFTFTIESKCSFHSSSVPVDCRR
jgi:hypothetical protein